MPRYFFHLIELATDDVDIDADGVVLPDADAARAEAVKVAGEMLRVCHPGAGHSLARSDVSDS